jgi:hypothetical protein
VVPPFVAVRLPPLEPDPEQLWHSRWGKPGVKSQNLSGLQDAQVDALIERGKVVLEEPHSDGEPMMIDMVSDGEPLGWSWLFAPYLWQFDARTLEPCSALCLSGIMLRQHRDEDFFLSHELFKRMSEVMVRRLQAARSRLSAAKKAVCSGAPFPSVS